MAEIIQTLRPIGPGSVPDPYLTNPDRGFFHYPEEPFWKTVLNEAVPDTQNYTVNGGHSSWAVTDTSVEISVALTPVVIGPFDTVNYIKSYAQVSSGINQSTGASVTPSGDGNYFNLGIRLGNPRQNFTQQHFASDSNYLIYTSTFTEKSPGEPFTPDDVANLEWYLSYGYYWTTSDKNYPINDNAHNDIGQAWVEISITKGVNKAASTLFLL